MPHSRSFRDLIPPLDLVIGEPGLLPIPPQVRSVLGLVPSDLLFLCKSSGALGLVPAEEALRRLRRMSDPLRRISLKEFRRHPVLVRDGAVRVPRRVFPLDAGERLKVRVEDEGYGPAMHLYRQVQSPPFA